ncbi:sun domain-containing protein 1 [Anoplophora glabripennis]|uniref:sun domain-containing protein 1 n=1 Tax=Anoplophora glabripennis TaxID=217634 RepID=UPI0008746D54|nr:sun domain-containing protein 1 [Anoplophora glabripennis]XP_023310177.1 sun domain-containing protein 1 [Anoplophora glabripennis]
MELRSSRSRSKTPFTQIESFDKELIERGNHVEKTVTRTTRRTTTVRTNDNATSSTDEFTSYARPVRRSARSERNVRKLYKTSDYSSEDGENEVSSTRTISQNERNQLIEDARAAANGTNEVSALNLYKKSGRYWDVYPKTDWTYSHHSKDRVELAPGIVAMPNMSRKTIHSVHSSDSSLSQTDFMNKETNTDTVSESQSQSRSDHKSWYADLYSARPRQLFNNNYDSDYEIYEKKSYTVSRWRRFTRSVVRIFTSIFTVFYYGYEVQTSWFAKLHKFTSRVMLLDTWLLLKTGRGNKMARLAALCLLPLLLFGGWWLLSSLGSTLYGAYFNSTATHVPVATKIEADLQEELTRHQDDAHVDKQAVEEKIIKITEKIYLEPPKANEIAAGLSSEQLEAISRSLKNSIDISEQFNTEDVVQKIVHNPSFQAIVNNYNSINVNKENANINLDFLNSQQGVIDNLREEIQRVKRDMLDIEKNRQEDLKKLLADFKAENALTSAHFTYQLNRCCRKPIINIESYVNRILGNLLNDAEFLKNQKGLNDYLHTMFVAKQDLELQLINLTRNLNSKYDDLIAENSRIIMDAVTKKITLELNENLKSDVHISKRDVSLGSVSEDRIKEIVKSTLAIYDADRTGLVDYAMETMGGQILTTRCTENYHYGKAVVSVLGIPLWYPVNSPRTIITPSISPGECWAFQNFPGFVVIRLSNRVQVEAFSLEHISKLLVPDGKIDSAPKDFEVYGFTSENDKEPVLLGTYVYNYDKEPLQFFPVQSEGHVFEIVEIRIISNHGNPNYTCLYRFRVHGKLSQEAT